MDCGIQIHPEAVSGFMELSRGRAKDTLKRLFLCEEFGLSEDGDGLDGEWIRIDDPLAEAQTYALRVFGYFVVVQSLEGDDWKPDEAVARLHNTLALQVVDGPSQIRI